MDFNAEETRFEDEETGASLRPGEMLGEYRIIRELGRGGMGEVYLAEQVSLKQQYALKVLPAAAARNPGFVRRFEEEARLLAKLDHPNIVRVHYAGNDQGRYYLAMEHAGGGSLEDELKAKGGRLPPEEVRDILLRVLRGLAYAHEGDAGENRKAVLHRDLKPANILRTRRGEIKISDFGLARVLGDEFVQTLIRRSIAFSQLGGQPTGSPGAPGSVTESYVGTIDYMAPEVRSGSGADRRSDLYAVGVMAYNLLTGEKPLGMAKPPSQLVKGLDRRWDRILGRCLEPRPEARYSDAREMLWALERLGLSKGPPAAVVTGAAALLAVGIAVGSWIYSNRVDTGETPITAEAGEREKAPTVPEPPSALGETTMEESIMPGLGAGQAEAASAAFTVRVDPREVDARLWIPGTRFANYSLVGGETRLEGLPAGDYEIVVQARGYERYAARLTIDAEGGEEVIRLAPVKGSLQVKADPDTEVTAVAADTGERIALGKTGSDGVLRMDKVLRIGTYGLELTKPKHRARQVEPVALVLGRTVTVTEDLEPLPGELSVFTVPQGAEIRLNGEVAGKSSTTLNKVPAEEPVTVSVSLQGYRRLERTVTLSAAESRMLDFGTLTAAAGDIRLRLTQPHLLGGRLSVEIDGRILGKHAIAVKSDRSALLEGIELGRRSVRLTHPDYARWEAQVSVRDQVIAELEVRLSPKPGILTVVTQPSVVFELEVDGKALSGRNGRYALPAEAAHTVTLKARGYKAATRMITLPPNGREIWAVALEKVTGPEEGRPWTIPNLGLEMVWIEPGAFLMGSPAGETDREKDELQHQVRLTRGYWLGRYEVTQREWQSIIGTSVKQQRDKADTDWPMRSEGDRRPIYYVSWEEAMRFCRKLTERERAAGRLAADLEYTLPTEAQWEYACRAGTTTPFHFGESLSSVQANFNGKYPYGGASKRQYIWRTVAVGTYRPNAWGLYDMHANVWEWCSDWYGDYSRKNVSDPTGPNSGAKRIFRGGGWINIAGLCRSAIRIRSSPALRFNDLGFRLCLRKSGNSQ